MKNINKKKCMIRNILICLFIALSLIFVILPNYNVYADTVHIDEDDIPDEGGGIMGSLLKEIIQLIDAVCDIIMGAFNKFMLGADSFSSVMLSIDDSNLDGDSGSWLTTNLGEADFDYGEGTIDTSEFLPWVHNKYDIPNFLYSPEAIFSNNIAGLDVNFLKPNSYTSVSTEESANKASKSAASQISKVISDWYISFRNIAIVGLLSVLIYLGIRIIISSTAGEKAKYKEVLLNWLVALCLVFFIHYLMSFLLMITDKLNYLFEDTANQGIIVQSYKTGGGTIKFRTNLIGFIRFNAQSKSAYDTVAYSILYVVLVFYTCRFTFMYYKRFLYMGFLTMIAPLVAITYPIDKYGDGKAQAFNMWFKEYVTHLILQPVHLILYVAFVSSAMELVKNNLLYGMVAIGFLIPAEKLIKKMFNLDGAQTTSGFGSLAGGVLAMQGVNKIASALAKGKSGGKSGSNSSQNMEDSNSKIRMQNRDFAQSFADNDRDRQTSQGNSNGANDPNDPNGANDPNNPNDPNDPNGANNPNGASGPNNPTGIGKNINANKHWKRNLASKMAIKGVKKLGKVAYKGAKIGTQVLGATGGAMVGVAAGAATGDFTKALQYAGTGAFIGKSIGKAGGNLVENGINRGVKGATSIRNAADNFSYEKDKAKYGTAYAKQQRDERINERERIKFMNNKAEKEKYEEMAGRISQETGKEVNAKDLMNSAFDYKVAGIDNEKQIENGLKMETKYGNDKNIHENMIDIVNMANNYGKDYVLDEKKRGAVQDMIKSNVSGSKNQNKVWNMYTEALGFDINKLGDKYKMNK